MNKKKVGIIHDLIIIMSINKRNNVKTYCRFLLFELCLFFRNEKKLQSMKKCVKKQVCGILLLFQKKKILEFNQYMKSDKMLYIIYIHTESLS